MKKYMLIITSLLLAMNLWAQTDNNWKGVYTHPAKIVRDGSRLNIELDLNLVRLDVKTENVILLTPYLINKDNQVDLKSVGIYGKHRYLYLVRQTDGMMMTGKNEISFQSSKKPQNLIYRESVTYEPWMENCQLVLRGEEFACCRRMLSQRMLPVGGYREVIYRPQFVYVSPAVETVKNRSLSGSAYIDFPVNKTVILPAYRNNQTELDKIITTINSVKEDKDITITSVFLKGYASPEGSYQGNERLAQGRVSALKDYVSQLYPQHKELIKTDSEPEDWEGFKHYVSESTLPHRAEILALIDENLTPDKKEKQIKVRYPEDYRILLQNCYPALRHSDYQIDYIVRSYADIEEIKRLVKENPKNLSLQEFYQAARTYPQGSDEFNEVFDIAVRLYPNDEVANLNAANIALAKKDMPLAHRYLKRAGNSKEARYAMGIYEALNKNYAEAVRIFERSEAEGILQATEALKAVRELARLNK